MKTLQLAALLAALNTASVAIPVAGTASLLATTTAAEACETDINCNQPTTVGKGQKAPVWHVVKCVIGPPNGPYETIACNDPSAIHISPRGQESVCFLGSDGKIHWDLPGIVYEGRTFKNIRLADGWQPLWTLTKAEKARLGIK